MTTFTRTYSYIADTSLLLTVLTYKIFKTRPISTAELDEDRMSHKNVLVCSRDVEIL